MSKIVSPRDILKQDSDNVVDLRNAQIEKNVEKRTGQYERVLDALQKIDKELEKLEELRHKLEWQKVQLRDQKRALERVIMEETDKITTPGTGRSRLI